MKTTIHFKLFGITLFTKEVVKSEQELINALEDRLEEVVINAILKREEYGEIASSKEQAFVGSNQFEKYKYRNTLDGAVRDALLRLLESANYAPAQ